MLDRCTAFPDVGGQRQSWSSRLLRGIAVRTDGPGRVRDRAVVHHSDELDAAPLTAQVLRLSTRLHHSTSRTSSVSRSPQILHRRNLSRPTFQYFDSIQPCVSQRRSSLIAVSPRACTS